MSRTFNIGIDIGLRGAIVVLSPEPFRKAIPPIQMPLIGKQLDINTLYKYLSVYQNTDCHVVFEQLAPIFGTSKATAFSMGYQLGIFESICVSLKLPYTKVPPKVWQKEMFMGVTEIIKQGKKRSRDTKAMALIAAKRLYPDMDFLATADCHVPHDGIIDALLMAIYCQRKK